MANFCCSIETEPRTLNQVELINVREIAVDIVQKMEVDEASSNMNEKAVAEIKEMEAATVVSDAKPLQKATEECIRVEASCQCSSSALAMESPPQEFRVKEPLSAPF